MQGGALPVVMLVCLLVGGVVESRAQSTLPAPWVGQDIGAPAVAGRSSASSGTFSVTGSGNDIGGTSDEFRFVYQPMSGDADVRVRVSNFTFADWTAKAGLMIRESLADNARFAYAFRYPSGGVSFRYRSSAGGGAVGTNEVSQSAPHWLRLVRSGNVFTAYRSTNGTSWTSIGSQTIAMGSNVYVGLAVTSFDGQASATGTFDNITGVQSSTPSSLPAPWAKQDVGSPSVAGTASESSGTFTVAGAGVDVWDVADQFQFVYQPLAGDAEIIARVASLQQTNAWSKAGVMIRESLAGASRNAYMFATPSNGWRFQRRIAASGETYATAGPSGVAPGWVRLVREGTLITAYHSTTGTSWTMVGSDTVSMGSTVYLGLAVTSHDAARTASATFTNVTVRAVSSGSNNPPTVSLSSPTSGATFTAPATIAMTAAASDTDGTVSKVDFYYGSTLVATDTTSPFSATWSNAPAGTYALKAVATDSDGATATSPTVNVTVNTSGNTPPTVSITSPAQGATFAANGEIMITASASDSDGISRVELYQGSTLLKSDTTSPYSYRWSSVPAGTYTITAVARDRKGATRTSSPVTVTVGASNQPPSVAITSPSAGASYTAPANMPVTASASDSDGRVTRVEFYRGSTLIGSDTTSPFSVTWSNVAAGSYTLTAKAFDEDGASRTSTGVNVTVSAASNTLPTVSITSPTSGASFGAPASVTISATASDPDGTIAGVDFYVGTQMIGSDSSSPYTASWTNVGAGSYSLTAVARDNAGGSRTSTAIAVTVTSTTLPTTVVFVPSSNASTAVTSYVVAIYRSTDAVTATPVATRDIGKPSVVNGESSVDISTLINPLAAGSYKAVVRAVGSGGTTNSAFSSTFTK